MARILIVDDEDAVRTSLVRILEPQGYEVVEASSAVDARELLRAEPFDLVLCDIRMPGNSGLDLLAQISTELPTTGVVMVTGLDDPSLAEKALEIGAYGYIVKPFRRNEILINVFNALRRRDLERQGRSHIEELEAKVLERTATLRDALERLEQAKQPEEISYRETVDRLAKALELRDEETGRHIQRVGLLSDLIARRSGLSPKFDASLRFASMLHDVGKIGIPDAILQKPGRLTSEEFAVMKRHCELGHNLLSGSSSPMLTIGATIALTHHEKWDGSGYPRGLIKEEIPAEGRITSIADVFDAMTSHRVYRAAFPVDQALAVIEDERGKAFDPTLVDSFLASLEEVKAIKQEFPDPAPAITPITVFIVDDHEMFAQSLIQLLERDKSFTVLGGANSVAAGVSQVIQSKPDVVLMDWELPDGTGGDATRQIRERIPETKVILLTGRATDEVALEAIEAGCAGYMTKFKAPTEVISAIRAVNDGESLIPPSTITSLLGRLRPEKKAIGEITKREREVLALLAEGLSNEAIAERLVLSLHTVRNHVQSVINKTGAHSKLEAVTKAVRSGLIKIP